MLPAPPPTRNGGQVTERDLSPGAPSADPPPPLPSYVFILGMLFPAFSFTGLDGPAHMSEESTNASLSAPWGIMLGVIFMIIVGASAGGCRPAA